MYVLANETVIGSVFDALHLAYRVTVPYQLKDYDFCFFETGQYYIEAKEGADTEALVVEVRDRDAWKLEQFQNPYAVVRDIWIEEEDRQVFAYFKRKLCSSQNSLTTGEMNRFFSRKRQLDMCDIYLVIPGKFYKNSSAWDHMCEEENEICKFFKESIDSCIREEYDNDFQEQQERKCLGEIVLEIERDIIEGERYRQPALMEIVRHETGLCILEIMVHGCYIGGNKLLNYYCGDQLIYEYQGGRYNVYELLEKLSIRPFGTKRSIVFVYGDTDDTAIINALANEEYPMGVIGGEFRRKLETENLAQYDIAEVYVSPVSMVERCNHALDCVSRLLINRIGYQVIEIFFVELLLYQDAAIDKIYKDLQREQINQEKGVIDTDKTMDVYESISFDMMRANQFANYECFNFPTVRESARRVAQSFGIEYVFQKYEANKELLASMTKANKRLMEEKSDNIKNNFFALITLVTTAQALGEALNAVGSDGKTGLISYGSALMIVIAFYFLYLLVSAVFRYHEKKKHSRR